MFGFHSASLPRLLGRQIPDTFLLPLTPCHVRCRKPKQPSSQLSGAPFVESAANQARTHAQACTKQSSNFRLKQVFFTKTRFSTSVSVADIQHEEFRELKSRVLLHAMGFLRKFSYYYYSCS
jgi:hypothetical protein